MRLSFRRRIFLGMVVLGTVPLTAALLVLAVQVRSAGSAIGPRAALDEVTESGRAMMATLDTTELSDSARTALRQHTQTIATGTNLARRAETLSRFAAGILATLILIAAGVLVTASLQLARRWSAYFSAPIDELVRWVGLIRRRESLPEPRDGNTAPEFDALRAALREMSDALETARRREVERERLVAFREIARRVAHEIRGPLTSSRLALTQLAKSDASSQSPRTAEIEVLQEELGRLDRLAREFSEFGRLPEGPEAPVDIGELLDSVVPATVPETVPVHRQTDGALVVQGHYEPLRRAVQNLLRNAVEATSARGIEVKASRTGDLGAGTIRLSIADHGPGVPSSQRDQIFEPYFTTKKTGTGLGLAIVKQTIVAHGGTIAVEDTLDGGATFVMELPERS